MRASSESLFGALREGDGTREAGSTVAESLVVLYWVGTHQIRRRRRAARSSTSQGRAEPLCTRIAGLNRESMREKLMSDHGHFSSYEGHKERRTCKIRRAFSRIHRVLDGWMLARAPASPAQGLHHHGPRYLNFYYFCTMCGLEKLGLVDQNWLERNFSGFLLRTLVVGRRQHSEPIEVALDMESGDLMNRFDIGRCHCV